MESYAFLNDMLRSAVNDGCFPWAVAAVGRRDRVLARAMAGGADLQTRFDMASVTKIIAPTMLALLAIERGSLTLYDRVSRFFDAPADKADITILELMTHTAGFEPHFFLSNEADDPDDAARAILRHPLAAARDGAPRYSCMGFILLGKILEKIYNTPLDEAARTHVFEPLGMLHTGYCPSGRNIAQTEVDSVTGTALCGVVHDENARFLGGVSGNAGVFSDIDDMILFASMLAQEGGGFLSPATLRKAIRNYTPGYDVHRGLGFHLAGTPENFMGDLFPESSFGHTGFTGPSVAVDPETGLYAILLTNRVHPTRENDKHLRFRRCFHNRVYAAVNRGRI